MEWAGRVPPRGWWVAGRPPGARGVNAAPVAGQRSSDGAPRAEVFTPGGDPTTQAMHSAPEESSMMVNPLAGTERTDCAEPPPSVKPAARPNPSGPSAERSLAGDRHRGTRVTSGGTGQIGSKRLDPGAPTTSQQVVRASLSLPSQSPVDLP